jgi:ubiquinone/menaquinone biosynthesis C-methylase UbiE
LEIAKGGSGLTDEAEIKAQVRQFYDDIGWKQIGEGLYQNARFEDLRPVARQYIHKCHLRVADHLLPQGRFLLDAGSGPIQYPEYLEYSRGYQRRVCLDISHRALVEARDRIQEHGLFVVGDVAHLPFADGSFDSMVSMHTIHHLPPADHPAAFKELYRTLRPGGKAVVVNSWGEYSALMRWTWPLVKLSNGLIKLYRKWKNRGEAWQLPAMDQDSDEAQRLVRSGGSYVHHHRYVELKAMLADFPASEIRVWRTLSTVAMRALIHRRLFGLYLLKILFWLEQRAPRLMGRLGQYAMILFEKPEAPSAPANRGQ